jgi:uncharacterized protein YbjQ (UPF0145 family)
MFLSIFFLAFTLRGFCAPVAALPETPNREAIANMTEAQKEARMQAMKERVNEIKVMDKSTLTREERKALRTELKQMNKEARAMGRHAVTGVYISVGALIIIILLLIIII